MLIKIIVKKQYVTVIAMTEFALESKYIFTNTKLQILGKNR